MTQLEISIAISLNKALADYVIFVGEKWQGVKCVYTNHFAKSCYIANIRRNETILKADYIYILTGDNSEYLIPYDKITTGRIYLSQYEENRLILFD